MPRAATATATLNISPKQLTRGAVPSFEQVAFWRRRQRAAVDNAYVAYCPRGAPPARTRHRPRRCQRIFGANKTLSLTATIGRSGRWCDHTAYSAGKQACLLINYNSGCSEHVPAGLATVYVTDGLAALPYHDSKENSADHRPPHSVVGVYAACPHAFRPAPRGGRCTSSDATARDILRRAYCADGTAGFAYTVTFVGLLQKNSDTTPARLCGGRAAIPNADVLTSLRL